VTSECVDGIQRATAWRCIATVGVAALVAGLLVVPSAPAQENCCQRTVWTAPFTLPEGDAANWSNQFAAAFDDGFHQVLPHSGCPLIVEFTGDTIGHDYRFVGVVKAEGRAQVDAEGHFRGTFIETVRLLDPNHAEAVLREGRVSWTGTLAEGLNHQVSTYDPSQDSRNPTWINPTGDLGKEFIDIASLIYDYERKPQSCQLTLERASPTTVQPGETVTIRVSDIFDYQSRPSQPWQRVYMKGEKGRILNGREKGEYRVFDVGDGNVSVTYRAPDDCKSAKDTVTVFNTCYTKNNPDGTPMDVVPDAQIASKEFDIVCNRVSIDCTYLHNPDRLEDYGLQFGGTVHAEVRLTTSEQTSGGYTMTQLGGEATGTQECWVEDPPGESRIENIRCPDFTASVVDGAVWPREYNFVLDVPDAAQLTYDLVTVFVPGDRPQRSPRREWGPIMCMETPIRLGREPDAVYTHRRTDDTNVMQYEVTARWANAGN
jgi:hypothetical protein